ncbi:DUF350 domain-containing protein [Serratia rhizosphaerae]|uniref:DUF350 domain-containing protein n=1 Tax=Serratia rhizosphaerae TaxID=2597702 RepID=A0ABX6GL06_9GAMM|nr:MULTISPECIES: DUF350 domain-containing protein [Serratia]MBU3894685.1 DUF350 domain-containing protein [Serratia rubidaea]AVJ15954.1 hypothetical protein CLM71_01770 [Serratia sp. MYb239]MCA4825363.1 DUF350 domain-containing protein [Serratia rubidaea]QHA86941.1 DUF350 domain-containing protein [Serratia rhizosphaerae]QNK32157.1 DUF350 domain-containing protein [Serratia sp. JUb9]
MDIISALAAFAAYFFSGFAMVLVFLFIYTRITAHDEWALIKQNNQSAAFGFVGACLGYVIPLASAAINSVSLLDYVIWGAVALVVQLLLFAAVKVYMPRISDKIEANHLAAGIFLGGVSISGGVLNAACMTY